jgi:ribonuclease HI
MEIATELHRLELALARRNEDAIAGGYEAVLDEAFEEVGQSGRVWTREAMLEGLRADPNASGVELTDLTVSELAPTVYLTRYDTRVGGRQAHRSSIWILVDDRLRLRYHQGTPVPGDR